MNTLIKPGLLLVSLVLLFSGNLSAQIKTNTVTKGIAPFRITLYDGNVYSHTQLAKNKPVMIVYFDPDCDHCHHFVNDLVKNLKAFEQVQVVMITYVPLSLVQKYVRAGGLDRIPQLKVGTEGTQFIVRYHYNIMQFPYLALHSRTGSLIATYESEVPAAMELAKLFR